MFWTTLSLILILVVGSFGQSYAQRLASIEHRFARQTVECGAGFDAAGRLAFERCGHNPRHFVPDLAEKTAIANGGTFTHNHPDTGDACWALSPDDVYLAEQLQLTEIRAVSVRAEIYRVSTLRRIGPSFSYIPPDVIEAEAEHQLTVVESDPSGCAYLSRVWAMLAPHYNLDYQVITAS